MGDDEFYEGDESVEDLRAAWNAGEKGTTSGPRDLNQRAKSIVDRAVARLEGRQQVILHVVDSGTSLTTEVRDATENSILVKRVDENPVSAAEYRVG